MSKRNILAYKPVLFLFVTALCAISCKKKSSPQNQVTYVNHIDENINLDFYPSLEDYKNNTNPHLKYLLSGNERRIFEESAFKAGNTYYVDWYSSDYRYNNWYNDMFNNEGEPYVRIAPVPGDNSYTTNSAYFSDNRIVFLKSNGSSTTWKAVDYYAFSQQTGYVSFWNTLSDKEKYREVTVYKDFKAAYTYFNASDSLVTDQLDFKVQHSKQAYIEFLNATGTSLGHMISGILPTGLAPNYISESKDTVLALLPNAPENLYLMVRQ